jgi:hypothetical protein
MNIQPAMVNEPAVFQMPRRMSSLPSQMTGAGASPVELMLVLVLVDSRGSARQRESTHV